MPHDSPKTVQLPDDTQLGPAKAKPAAPVTWLASDTSAPEPGLGLSLSGGGTRAMLFHAGALLRLYEMGLFGELRRISSVSGGSITAGVLGLKWTALAAATTDRRSLFLETVVEPVRRLAGRRIDIVEWLRGTLTISGRNSIENTSAATIGLHKCDRKRAGRAVHSGLGVHRVANGHNRQLAAGGRRSRLGPL